MAAAIRRLACRPSLLRAPPPMVAIWRTFADDAASPAAAPTNEELAKVLKYAGKGRMDRALALAKPLAARSGEVPARFVSRACSDRAAEQFRSSAEARERAIGLALTGATFDLPGRLEPMPSHLAEGFWLRDVSLQHKAARTMTQLARASLALRGLDGSAEAAEMLHTKIVMGDAEAQADALVAAQDYQVIGSAVVLQLITSRPCCVLQAWVGRSFNKEMASVSKYPTLFTLLMKLSQNFQDNLQDQQGGSTSDQKYDLPGLQRMVDMRQNATGAHMRFVSEIISEAAMTFVKEPAEQAALLRTAEIFYQTDCPPAERAAAIKVFRQTAARLGV